ncbi:MAG TPA: hypothetical protein VIN59_02880 [Alphaproteobacteria bacterium]
MPTKINPKTPPKSLSDEIFEEAAATVPENPSWVPAIILGVTMAPLLIGVLAYGACVLNPELPAQITATFKYALRQHLIP